MTGALQWLEVVTRALHVGGLLSLFGATLFGALPAQRTARPALRQTVALSIGASLIGLALWLGATAAKISTAATPSGFAADLWLLLTTTRFGHVATLQAAVIVASAASHARPACSASLAGFALSLHALSGHAAGAGGQETWVLAAGILHLLAAGAWLGGLVPLAIAVRHRAPADAAVLARRFSPLGIGCVVMLALTALVQGHDLIGGYSGLFGTAYGRAALIKLTLFVALLSIAAINRQFLVPALTAGSGERALRRLKISIAVETAVGLAVVAAAALLATRPPAVHEQPLWPFPLQPSLLALDDPDLRREVLSGLFALGLGVIGIGYAVAVRKLRWPILTAGLAALWFSARHLDLLMVPAYPTSFYQSPTGFSAESIASGGGIYATHCASCHGVDGRGGGQPATSAVIVPANLTADHLWDHPDGELFWWLSHGIDGPERGLAMPGFAGTLSEDERWAVIDYVHAHAAGADMQSRERWTHPVRLPDMSAICPDETVLDRDALSGGEALLTATAASIDILPLRTDRPPQRCINTDPAFRAALATIAGLTADGLDGVQMLVDDRGWLRARWLPGAAPLDHAALLALVQTICAQPVASPAGTGHHHR